MGITDTISNTLSFLKLGESRKIFYNNPINNQLRQDVEHTYIKAYEYNEQELIEHEFASVQECARLKDSRYNVWLNIEGLKRDEIKFIAQTFGINDLVEEDISSIGHNAKMDTFENYIYCLVYMLSYNNNRFFIEQEQISIICGRKFVITFQEEHGKDAFGKLRLRLQNKDSKVRLNSIDFLFYELLDAIVDDYFYLMDKLSMRIETVEDEILNNLNKRSFAKIIFYRREMMILRRNIYPFRDIITVLMRNEDSFFTKRTLRYLKDVSDHINQAREMVENYRESISNIQDLYLNQENNKLSRSMKVTAIVTCLLAPATVIGGIFGMNFKYIPFLNNPYAFYVAIAFMLLIPVYMIYVFKKNGWF